MAVIHYSSSLKDFGLAYTVTTGKLHKLFTVCYFETLCTKQSIYVIWLWLSSLHSYTSSTSQIIRTKESCIMSIDDELTIIYHLLYQFGDFLLLGGECFVRASKCRNRRVDFSSMKEIFKENWEKKTKRTRGTDAFGHWWLGVKTKQYVVGYFRNFIIV